MSELRTEKTFDVTATAAEGWKALEGLRARAAAPDEWWLPGFECRGAEVEEQLERCDALLLRLQAVAVWRPARFSIHGRAEQG